MTPQAQYQVRFDWGTSGATAVGDGADVIIWVDEQPATPRELPSLPLVVAGGIRNSAAVAEWVLSQQGERGDRFTVAVIAAGEKRSDGSLRFAVEDLLGAGAVIDALAAVGIDYCSPEAAAACAAYTSLCRGAAHLISASESGMALGMRMPDLDPVDEVPVFRQ
ncbi:2-phosphosulfolactate phosphatase [Homoserinimonas sp. A447]